MAISKRNIGYLTGWVILLSVLATIKIRLDKQHAHETLTTPLAVVNPRSFDVDVRTVGELEAARSTIIASTIRGDLGKVIFLISDGQSVSPGDILVKMDPSPFEERVQELKAKLRDQEAYITSLDQTLKWETNQAEAEIKSSIYEVESAELELNKVLNGDGPLETSRLKSSMQKARIQYEELNYYSDELIQLEKEGFLNVVELKNAQKKLNEEKEAYEVAKMQYESFIQHVFPMQVKKAQSALERARLKHEEAIKSAEYRIVKATNSLNQARQSREDFLTQIRMGERELASSEIKAPAPGMVVLREDYRSGQRRKPRIGDVLVRNQPLLDLPDLESMIVKTKVREVDLHKIQVGKLATVQVDAYPQLSFSGKVLSIGILALADTGRTSEEKYFEVRVGLDAADPRLRPGMTSRVVIHADHVQDQLTIPFHALFNHHKDACCYVKAWGGYERRIVVPGASNEQWVEIKSGLEPGESIALAYPPKRELLENQELD